jgi:adenosylcobinamide kinase/adenosylcobinamide-phosphate guanylyltransferase
LTLWLTNLLVAERDLDDAFAELDAVLAARRGPVVLVSNEVGAGVVPMNAMARRFVDEAGRLHQRIAAGATEVVLVTAGIVRTLKGIPGGD